MELEKQSLRVLSVVAYRTPEFKWTELLKSILTLGRANQERMSEAAALYVFETKDDQTVFIYTETMAGKREQINQIKLSPEEFKGKVFDEKKLVYEGYRYHFDPDTVIVE